MGRYCATVRWKLSSTIVNGFVHNIELQSNERNRDILLLFQLLWFANRAALEAMDQSLPRRPALFLRLVLILKPSRFRKLFSNLWVTPPHTTTPTVSLWPFNLVRHGSRSHELRQDYATTFARGSTGENRRVTQRTRLPERFSEFRVDCRQLGNNPAERRSELGVETGFL